MEYLKLALGTAQFGLDYGVANKKGQVSRATAKEMLELARFSGIDTLDTAIAYGESESCLGEVGVKGFKLITKIPEVPNDCNNISQWINDQLEVSLSHLDTKTIHAVLLHRPIQLLGEKGVALFEALEEIKDLGLVSKIGISASSPDEVAKITEKFSIDLVQVPFNLVDRRLYHSGCLAKLKGEGIEVHVRSVFLQGLLLMPQAAIPEKFSKWGSLWNRWHDWLSSNNVSAVQACLAFPLSFPEIDRVIVGADDIEQMQQIIIASMSDINVSELPDINSDSEDLITPSLWSNL